MLCDVPKTKLWQPLRSVFAESVQQPGSWGPLLWQEATVAQAGLAQAHVSQVDTHSSFCKEKETSFLVKYFCQYFFTDGEKKFYSLKSGESQVKQKTTQKM